MVVLDDEDRENEGDLIINADKVTTEAMAFMVEHTSGVVSVAWLVVGWAAFVVVVGEILGVCNCSERAVAAEC